MKTKKMLFILFAMMIASTFAFGQQRINLKIGSVSPDNSPWSVEQKKMAQDWARITNGEVTVTFMSATALGGENGVIQKMRLARPGRALEGEVPHEGLHPRPVGAV